MGHGKPQWSPAALRRWGRENIGALVMGFGGLLVAANQRGEAVLTSDDGLGILDGFVYVSISDDAVAWQPLIDAGLRGHGGFLRVRRPSGKAPYAVVIRPASGEIPGRREQVIVLITESDEVDEPGHTWVDRCLRPRDLDRPIIDE